MKLEVSCVGTKRDHEHRSVDCLGLAIGVATILGSAPALSAEVRAIEVEASRPLHAAVELLRKEYGYRITYEDPPYEYAGDIKDVTSLVRRDLGAGSSPKASQRVFVPRGGRLAAQIPVGSATEAPIRADIAVAPLVNAQNALAVGARFRTVERNGVLQLIPESMRAASGDWVKVRPLLDTVCTLPSGTRPAREALEEILAQLRKATTERVEANFPLRAVDNVMVVLDGKSESARDALTNVLTQVDPDLTWFSLYDPGLKWTVISAVFGGAGIQASERQDSPPIPPAREPNAPNPWLKKQPAGVRPPTQR
jgi:hypothetical protein